LNRLTEKNNQGRNGEEEKSKYGKYKQANKNNSGPRRRKNNQIIVPLAPAAGMNPLCRGSGIASGSGIPAAALARFSA
jgi:hypothetical protein